MTAYDQCQTSGNQWEPGVPVTDNQGSEGPELRQEPKSRGTMFDELAHFERQMRSFRAEHEASVNNLRRHFVFPSDSSVTIFLIEHRTLPQILLEAAVHLKTIFGTETIFNLRAPIDESGSRTLYVVALWSGNVRKVREHLAQFDESWWIANSRQTSGYLNFTYELV